MIERYSRPEMANIWTEENKYRAWLEVEILADEAWAELGEIPKEDVALIREKADFDIDRILEIEQQTRHDVVAFTRAVSETLGEERKWVHYGLTSTDVVDTAYGYLYKQANDIIRKDLENFLNIIADKAKEHKFTIMMGRTHGVHAEPTTFGLKLATWYSEMKRNIERFEHAAVVWKLVRFLVRLVTLPTSHHSLKNTSATNLVSVLKKSLHRSFLVTFTLSILQFLRASQLLSSVWQLKFVVFKNLNNVKWKSSLLKVKKGLQQCHTNVTLSVLKI